MSPATSIEARCPFGEGFVCIQGCRYRRLPDDAAPVRDPLPQDMPGLLFVGRCDCCEKATGGVR